MWGRAAARWRSLGGIGVVVYLLVLNWVCLSGVEGRNGTDLRMLWTTPTPLDDFGFSFSIDRARLAVEESLNGEGYLVQTYLITNLSVTQCMPLILETLNAGLNGDFYDIWVIGGQQYSSCVDQIVQATQNDTNLGNLKFMHVVGVNASERVAVISPSMHEVRFLHGLLCAKASESRQSRKVGFVTGLPRSNTVLSRSLNAFVLGVKEFNPAFEVLVGITGSFLDPVAERKATELLLDAGAACIGQQQNGLTVNIIANNALTWSVGYTTDARIFTGSGCVISSMELSWLNPILEVTRSVLFDSWVPSLYLESGYANDTIAMTSYSTAVNDTWRALVDPYIEMFKNQSKNIFCTPNFNDPQYIGNPKWTETIHGQTCLNQSGLTGMLGVINSSTILVEFGPENSPYVILWIKWNRPGPIFFIVFLGILIIAALGSMIDVAINRRSPVYRASSPLFCFLILIGVVLFAIGPYLMIGERTKYNCMAPWWAFGIGYATIFSCLMAKNWRIWRIFASGKFKVVAIMNTQLLSRWLGGVLLIEVAILTLWTIFDPQLPKTLTNPELAYDQLQLMCISKSGKAFGLTVFSSVNVAMLVPLAFISWRTRHAKEEYRESRAIAMIVLTSFIVQLIGIGVLVALPNDYQTYFYIFSFGVCLIIVAVLGTLFLPKIWRIHFPSSGISSPETGTSQGVSYLQSQAAPESMTGFESRPPSFTNGSRTDASHQHISRDIESRDQRSREAPNYNREQQRPHAPQNRPIPNGARHNHSSQRD